MRVLVVAPHADDETLGCGGTILRATSEGDEEDWLIVAGMTCESGYSVAEQERRQSEIRQVSSEYGFRRTLQLGFPSAAMSEVAEGVLVSRFSEVFRELQPEAVYLPYRFDVHGDHRVIYDAAVSCTKVFRHPTVKRVYCYETLSESEFGMRPDATAFRPQRFVDISDYLERKIQIMSRFRGEMGHHPFPRSEVAIRAQASLRGVVAGVAAAEGFMVLREIV